MAAAKARKKNVAPIVTIGNMFSRKLKNVDICGRQ